MNEKRNQFLKSIFPSFPEFFAKLCQGRFQFEKKYLKFLATGQILPLIKKILNKLLNKIGSDLFSLLFGEKFKTVGGVVVSSPG